MRPIDPSRALESCRTKTVGETDARSSTSTWALRSRAHSCRSARQICSADRGGRWLVALAASLAMIAGAAAPAFARSEKTVAYRRDQVWPTAVRFLVVDEHVKVTEKDADAGYVMFELRDDGKTFRGALEVMTVVRDGRTLVRFVLQIEDRPSWLELAMLARLEIKLRAELGSPSPPPSPPEPAPPAKDAPKPEPARPDGPRPDEHGPPISPTP
jgi:hypothetical protein